MTEYLVSSLLNMWPYYLLGLIVAEVLFFIREQRGLRSELFIAFVILCGLTTLGYFQAHNSWVLNNKPISFMLVNVLSILVPLVIFVIVNQYLVHLNKTVIKHIWIFVTTTSTISLWPLFALYLTCASGLDCL